MPEKEELITMRLKLPFTDLCLLKSVRGSTSVFKMSWLTNNLLRSKPNLGSVASSAALLSSASASRSPVDTAAARKVG